MNVKKLLQSKRSGSIIPLAVVVIVLLLAMGMGLLSLGFHSYLCSIQAASEIAAQCAADAGLTAAIFEMNKKLKVQPWNDVTLPKAINVSLPYCDAVCSYEIRGDFDSGYLVTSVGEAGRARKTVYAMAGLKGVFDQAVQTKADLILKSDTLVDGYNSLDSLDDEADADIVTQSTSESSIILNNGVRVNGDIRVGRGGNPETVIKDYGATVNGFKYPTTENELLPNVTVPETLFDRRTAINVKGETVTITPADNGIYSAINLKSDTSPGVLEICDGDVVMHVTGDIELGNSSEIIVKEGSTLTLYVDGDIHCRESSSIRTESASKQAKTIELYATGEELQSFDLKASSEWVGVVYAPNANVQLHANGDIYGAVVANIFELKAGGSYYYDQALKIVSVEDEGVHFVVKRWYKNLPASVTESQE